MLNEPVEHMHPCKGVQSRPPRAMYLIKKANVCGNCIKCDTMSEKTGKGFAQRTSSILVCSVFNCKVGKEEWCKHHKK